MNVLSLFDGMSCGQIALNRCGIKYENYFASEIDKYAADKTDSVGGQYSKYESKLYLLAKQDEYLNKLLAIRNYAKQRVDRLTYLSSSIKNLADTFLSVSKTKIALRERT